MDGEELVSADITAPLPVLEFTDSESDSDSDTDSDDHLSFIRRVPAITAASIATAAAMSSNSAATTQCSVLTPPRYAPGQDVPDECRISAIALDCDGTLISGSSCSRGFDAKLPRYQLTPLLATAIRWCIEHNVSVAVVSYGMTRNIMAVLAAAFDETELRRIHLITPSVVRRYVPALSCWQDGSYPPLGFTRVVQLEVFRTLIGAHALPAEQIALVDDDLDNARDVAAAGYTAMWLRGATLATVAQNNANAHRMCNEALRTQSCENFSLFWKRAFCTSDLSPRIYVSRIAMCLETPSDPAVAATVASDDCSFEGEAVYENDFLTHTIQ
jgi:hypothetical protein